MRGAAMAAAGNAMERGAISGPDGLAGLAGLIYGDAALHGKWSV